MGDVRRQLLCFLLRQSCQEVVIVGRHNFQQLFDVVRGIRQSFGKEATASLVYDAAPSSIIFRIFVGVFLHVSKGRPIRCTNRYSINLDRWH